MDKPPLPPKFLISTLFSREDPLENVSIYKEDSQATPTPMSSSTTRPHVTLTFAQSLDAKIAGKNGMQLILSGRESLIMTHWMRTMHDAILVGIGTALNDDPQLNTRHLPALPSGYPYKYHIPRPVILDTQLRLSPTCKLLKNHRDGCGRRPWVFCSAPTDRARASEWTSRRTVLERAGAIVYVVDGHEGLITLMSFLEYLSRLGVRSLMVEGGARVIQSFLAGVQASSDGQAEPIVDTVIVTVAPTFVGTQGIGYGWDASMSQAGQLVPVKSETFGPDAVLAMKIIKP